MRLVFTPMFAVVYSCVYVFVHSVWNTCVNLWPYQMGGTKQKGDFEHAQNEQ